MAVFVSSFFKPQQKINENSTNILESSKGKDKKFDIPLLFIFNEEYLKESAQNESLQQNIFLNEHSNSSTDIIKNEFQNFTKYEEAEIDKSGYIGCYNDDAPGRDLQIRIVSEKMIPLKCRSECGKMNYQYSSVQYGYLCFCGHKYGKYGQANESLCNTPCSGNSSLACGGVWKNLVYDTIKQLDEKDSTNFTDWYLEHMKNKSPKILIAKLITATVENKTEPIKNISRNITNIPVINHTFTTISNSKRNIITTSITEGVTTFINAEYLTKSGVISYICFIILRQPWLNDLANTESNSYKIMHGNFIDAMLKETRDIDSIYNIEFLRFVQSYTKLSGRRNQIKRVGVYFRIITLDDEYGSDSNAIMKIRQNIEENRKLGGMPVFISSFRYQKQKSNKQRSDLRERTKREGIKSNNLKQSLGEILKSLPKKLKFIND